MLPPPWYMFEAIPPNSPARTGAGWAGRRGRAPRFSVAPWAALGVENIGHHLDRVEGAVAERAHRLGNAPEHRIVAFGRRLAEVGDGLLEGGGIGIHEPCQLGDAPSRQRFRQPLLLDATACSKNIVVRLIETRKLREGCFGIFQAPLA
mgnify:CR=1 FL=1